MVAPVMSFGMTVTFFENRIEIRILVAEQKSKISAYSERRQRWEVGKLAEADVTAAAWVTEGLPTRAGQATIGMPVQGFTARQKKLRNAGDADRMRAPPRRVAGRA
jgi:hypothetical protein